VFIVWESDYKKNKEESLESIIGVMILKIDLTNVKYDLIGIKDKKDCDIDAMDIEVDSSHYYTLENGIVSHNSVSIETQTTSGIEPLFMPSYKRRKKINPNDENAKTDFIDDNGDRWQEFIVYHPKIKMWMEITGKNKIEDSPWFGCCAEDLDWVCRVNLQAAAGRHVDHSISSTINLPEDVSVEKVADIYETAWKAGLKGITVYRKNCRSGVLVENNENNENDEDKKDRIKHVGAPKRPDTLPSDVFHCSVKGEQYFVIVGLMNGEPYETFAGKNGHINRKAKTANIIKVKRGHYRAEFDDGSSLDNIAEFCNEDQEAITRLLSLSLRHGNDLNFMVHQLEKVKGDLSSFAKAIARQLKRYIPDGVHVKGETCNECGNDSLVRAEGCILCSSCGWSKCS